jgi:hypothetical protein
VRKKPFSTNIAPFAGQPSLSLLATPFRRKIIVQAMPSESRKIPYGVPRKNVAMAVLFFATLVLLFGGFAVLQPGAARYFFTTLATMFAVLAILPLIIKLMGPRSLKLSEDGIFISRPSLRKGRVYVKYSKIVRLSEGKIRDQTVLRVITREKEFEICSSYFETSEDYSFVRNTISSRSSIDFPPDHDSRAVTIRGWREAPPPLLHWTEPEDWVRYRESIVAAQPLSSRLAKTLWFATRCLAIIVIPWLVLHFSGSSDASFAGYFSLAVAVTAFFTLLHWMFRAHPARIAEIVLRTDGLTIFSGKQTANVKYDQYSGWRILEQPFEGRRLSILLLEARYGIRTLAVPDAVVRDEVARILETQKVPANPNLKPCWE